MGRLDTNPGPLIEFHAHIARVKADMGPEALAAHNEFVKGWLEETMPATATESAPVEESGDKD